MRSHTDTNECEIPSLAALCAENAECCNLPGHFVCKCKPGFTGNATVSCTGIMRFNATAIKMLLTNDDMCVRCLIMQTLMSVSIRAVAEEAQYVRTRLAVTLVIVQWALKVTPRRNVGVRLMCNLQF